MMPKHSSGLAKFNADFVGRSLAMPEIIAIQQEKIRNCLLPPAYESLRHAISPWPVIVTDKTVKEMNDACSGVTTLLFKALQIISTEFPELFTTIYGSDIADLALQNQQFWKIEQSIGRYDAVMVDGCLKLLEYNSGTNIGGWHLYRCTDAYKEIIGGGPDVICTPILERFLTAVYRMVRDKMVTATETIRLLFVVDSDEAIGDLTGSLPFFRQALVQCGIEIEMFWTDSLDEVVVTSEGVYFSDARIHALSFPVVNFDYRNQKIEAIVALHLSGKVVFPDMPAFLVAGYKSNFANLCWLNSHGKFAPAEAELIRRFIPATFYLSDEINSAIDVDTRWLLDEVERKKDSYVIKRDGFFGGDHVYVGKFVSQQAWQNILSVARRSNNWIVQQYCESDLFQAPERCGNVALHNYIFGFFNFAGCYGGAGVRLMRVETGGGVVNSAKGAQYTAILEVQPQTLLL